MRKEMTNTIYIRTSGAVMTIGVSYPDKRYYWDFDLMNKKQEQKALFRTIIRSHKDWPINIMYEDFRKVRSWFDK